MSQRTTLKDVAREAGVHVSTASRALNPATASVVNRQTLERVTEAAHRLGYRPHPLARGLRTNRTMSAGVVIPDVENPLFGPIIAGAESVLVEQGYSVLIGNADRGSIEPGSVVSNLLERRVDGLILATATIVDEVVSDLVHRKVPTVLVNRHSNDPVPAIVGDDYAGIRLAVQHLASLGHRHIGHVAGPAWVSTGRDRRDAFLSSIDELGLEADPDRIEEAEWFRLDPGYRAGVELLRRHPEVTAIVAANDLLGLGCYRAIRSLDLEVPRDVSVTGYNDIPFLDLMQPPMTTVRIPYRELGSEAAATLLSLLDRVDEFAPQTVRLAPTLEIRSSTASPRDRP